VDEVSGILVAAAAFVVSCATIVMLVSEKNEKIR
tara:strand:+ start:512 stop:613 length:102 start_codon:yes stop_codon:yes gene_type:complete